MAAQAETAYLRLMADSQPVKKEGGRGLDTGARISKALEGQSRAADSISPKVCSSLPSVTRTHIGTFAKEAAPVQTLA